MVLEVASLGGRSWSTHSFIPPRSWERSVWTQGLKDMASDVLASLGTGHSCVAHHADPDTAPLLRLEAGGGGAQT